MPKNATWEGSPFFRVPYAERKGFTYITSFKDVPRGAKSLDGSQCLFVLTATPGARTVFTETKSCSK